jgi:hypothetical protein
VTTHLGAASALALLLSAVTLCYAIGCWIWPFRPCRVCAGTGRRRSPTGRAIRLCRWCRGTGLRLRAGRWIWNYLTHLRKEGRTR